MTIFNTFLSLLKVKHYIKNAVCFIPLLFSMKVSDVLSLKAEIFMFLAFCLISSSVYIFNDIFDVKEDKLSSIKKNRPIASGRVPVPFALLIMLVLIAAGLLICKSINLLSLVAVVCYLVLNIFYTIWLKNIEIIDVFCIALGFILRILSGCAAIMVIPSPLVVLLTFFVSMFFTFSKRKLELEYSSPDKKLRKALKDFTPELINQFVCANAILSIAFYFAYVMDSTTILKTGAQYLFVSAIPFTLIIFRLLFLVNAEKENSDPAEIIYKDAAIKNFFFFYLVVLFFVLDIL